MPVPDKDQMIEEMLSQLRSDLNRPAGGASEDAVEKFSQSTGALSTDAIWKLLNEADDQQLNWSGGAWRQWFVQLVDAVSQLDSDMARLDEYNSGCAICHKATQNGVWGCDLCWDEIKVLCAEFLRLRQRAAFDQAHGLRPLEQPESADAVDPHVASTGKLPTRDTSSSSSDAALAARAEQADARKQQNEELLAFLERMGYRRCDVAACNCNGWHGGHAAQRLVEIGDALTEAGIDLNGKTVLEGVREVLRAEQADARRWREDVEALETWAVDDPLSPFVGEIVVCLSDVLALLAGEAAVSLPQPVEQKER